MTSIALVMRVPYLAVHTRKEATLQLSANQNIRWPYIVAGRTLLVSFVRDIFFSIWALNCVFWYICQLYIAQAIWSYSTHFSVSLPNAYCITWHERSNANLPTEWKQLTGKLFGGVNCKPPSIPPPPTTLTTSLNCQSFHILYSAYLQINGIRRSSHKRNRKKRF